MVAIDLDAALEDALGEDWAKTANSAALKAITIAHTATPRRPPRPNLKKKRNVRGGRGGPPSKLKARPRPSSSVLLAASSIQSIELDTIEEGDVETATRSVCSSRRSTMQHGDALSCGGSSNGGSLFACAAGGSHFHNYSDDEDDDDDDVHFLDQVAGRRMVELLQDEQEQESYRQRRRELSEASTSETVCSEGDLIVEQSLAQHLASHVTSNAATVNSHKRSYFTRSSRSDSPPFDTLPTIESTDAASDAPTSRKDKRRRWVIPCSMVVCFCLVGVAIGATLLSRASETSASAVPPVPVPKSPNVSHHPTLNDTNRTGPNENGTISATTKAPTVSPTASPTASSTAGSSLATTALPQTVAPTTTVMNQTLAPTAAVTTAATATVTAAVNTSSPVAVATLAPTLTATLAATVAATPAVTPATSSLATTLAPSSALVLSTDVYGNNTMMVDVPVNVTAATVPPTLTGPLWINSGGLSVTLDDANATTWQSDYSLLYYLVGSSAALDLCDNNTVASDVPNSTETFALAPLYCSARWFDGPGGYDIPVPVGSGPYSVTLHFAELVHVQPGQRVFDVSIEGQVVYPAYDAFLAAGNNGWTADTVSATIPVVADGVLSIQLIPIVDNASICAVEVVPMYR